MSVMFEREQKNKLLITPYELFIKRIYRNRNLLMIERRLRITALINVLTFAMKQLKQITLWN